MINHSENDDDNMRFIDNLKLWMKILENLKEKLQLVQWNKGGRLSIYTNHNLQKSFVDSKMIENWTIDCKNLDNKNKEAFMIISEFTNCSKIYQDDNILDSPKIYKYYEIDTWKNQTYKILKDLQEESLQSFDLKRNYSNCFASSSSVSKAYKFGSNKSKNKRDFSEAFNKGI